MTSDVKKNQMTHQARAFNQLFTTTSCAIIQCIRQNSLLFGPFPASFTLIFVLSNKLQNKTVDFKFGSSEQIEGKHTQYLTPTTAIGKILFFKWANPDLFVCLCSVFSNKHCYNFLQQINVKNVHPVSGAGIGTHNLLITSLLP